jgi:sensor histidine kinase YesM
LFENAVKHSNIKDDLQIKISVTENDSHLTFKVTNAVDKPPSPSDLDKLAKINSDLANNNIDNFMKDFGSGLYKVKKILSLDLKSENDVFVEYVGLAFRVNVNFKKNNEFLSAEK